MIIYPLWALSPPDRAGRDFLVTLKSGIKKIDPGQSPEVPAPHTLEPVQSPIRLLDYRPPCVIGGFP